MKYEFAQANRLGNRPSNQDRTGYAQAKRAVLLVLADGMGGHAGGELAAQVLVDTLLLHFGRAAKPFPDPQAFLERSILDAHQQVIAAGQRCTPPVNPRTTCVACLVQDGTAWWAHTGDSRLYLFREGKPLFRTHDHTFVEQLYQDGLISKKDLLSHPLRNYVTQCIGGDVVPQVTRSLGTPLEHGDTILLCSDGLWAALSDGEMGRLLAAEPSLEGAAEKMASCAEVAAYPFSDNISIVTLRWLSQPSRSHARPKERGRHSKVPGTGDKKDGLSSAIEEITRAIEKYEKEMKP